MAHTCMVDLLYLIFQHGVQLKAWLFTTNTTWCITGVEDPAMPIGHLLPTCQLTGGRDTSVKLHMSRTQRLQEIDLPKHLSVVSLV